MAGICDVKEQYSGNYADSARIMAGL